MTATFQSVHVVSENGEGGYAPGVVLVNGRALGSDEACPRHRVQPEDGCILCATVAAARARYEAKVRPVAPAPEPAPHHPACNCGPCWTRRNANPWRRQEERRARQFFTVRAPVTGELREPVEVDCAYDQPEYQQPRTCSCGGVAWKKATVGAYVCTECGAMPCADGTWRRPGERA